MIVKEIEKKKERLKEKNKSGAKKNIKGKETTEGAGWRV